MGRPRGRTINSDVTVGLPARRLVKLVRRAGSPTAT